MANDAEAAISHIGKDKEVFAGTNYVGSEITNIRILLNMSQQDFADAIIASRATINRIERGGDISSDLAFRLYYAMQKLRENIYIDEDIKEQCFELQKYIESNYILKRCRISHIAYSIK